MSSKKKAFLLVLFPALLSAVCLCLCVCFSEDARFARCTERIFAKEISGSTLNLHYTLAHPEKCGISPSRISLGAVYAQTPDERKQALEKQEKRLSSFSPKKLSRENRITRDLLLLWLRTEASLGERYLLDEVLSPSLGIQAQLPVLLAEYPFYDEQDIRDYLKLLTCLEPYFQSVLAFERKKSNAGCFMSDESLDRVLAQCRDFLAAKQPSYLEDVFSEKLSAFERLAPEQKAAYQKLHKKLLRTDVFPAYEHLTDGLLKLRGTGKNENGLYYFKGGRAFYTYLLHSQCGVYTTAPKAWERLYAQLLADFAALQKLLSSSPEILRACRQDLPKKEPQALLKELKDFSAREFPALRNAPYSVKYVHESLERFSSPAFYLTPPVDTQTPNTIYLNRGSRTTNLELFTTLAHEGFPGHLYQTLTFAGANPAHIRHLLSFGGYVEGWATYAESFAYRWCGLSGGVSEVLRLNRSLNLCLYSLLDIGIHYYGWTEAQAGEFLAAFGIREARTVHEIFRYIVETPANYLKYYLGFLNFLDLRDLLKKKEGDRFDLRTFHAKVLAIGPAQFPVLKKYLLSAA